MPKRTYARPRDRSLQAYKDWIDHMVHSLIPDLKDDMSEEEWVERWQRFWSKAGDDKGAADEPKKKAGER